MMVIHASLIAVLAAVFVVQASGDSLKTVYFSEFCPRFIYAVLRLGETSRLFNSSVIIKAVPDGFYYNSNINCRLKITVPPGHNIVASVRLINLRGDCSDNLTLSEEHGYYVRYCGSAALDRTESQSRTFQGTMIIEFKTGGGNFLSNLSYRGFELTVTTYRSSPCISSSEFRCRNNRCIAKELRCDGHNHCGDRSDQLQCPSTCSPTQFRCWNEECISSRFVCDGDRDCSDGSDEINCGSCAPDRFRCQNGQCIRSSYVCDGYRHCSDGSDEINCASTCSPGQFRCRNEQCISSRLVCDGDRDCTDGSDEINCGSCAPDRFRCQNGQCIRSSYVCDGHRHCSDGSDEINCASTCSSVQFRCANGRCILSQYVCNGNDDCGDRSDERNCPSTRVVMSSARGPDVVLIAIVLGTLGFLALSVGVIVWLRKRRTVTRGTVIQSDSAPPMAPPPPYSVAGHVPLLQRVNLLYQATMPSTQPSGDLQNPSHKEIHQETQQPPPYS